MTMMHDSLVRPLCVPHVALIVALVAALTAPTLASTLVPAGLVLPGTVWTVGGSPYIVTGDIQVSLLTIQAGVEVLVDSSYRIDVLTTIDCEGTDSEPVLFTSSDPTLRWTGIKFDSTPPGSTFLHTNIERSSGRAVTLTNCASPYFEGCRFFDNTTTGQGGAVSASGVSGDLWFSDCEFTSNTSGNHGGALRVQLDSGALYCEDSVFTGNKSNPGYASGNFVGGAIYLAQGDANIARCLFDSNRANARCSSSFDCTAKARGGAIYVGDAASLVAIDNCMFRGNITDARNNGNCFYGGHSYSFGCGVYVDAGTVTLGACILSCGNAVTSGGACGTDRRGGGLYVNGGTVVVEHCTIARNANATGIYRAGGSVELVNSIVYFNNGTGAEIGGTVTASYCDIQGTAPFTGDGNIFYQPAFSGTGCTCDDLTISIGSPCMDTGDPSMPLDACQPPSIGTTMPDIGAHGGARSCDWTLLTCALPPHDFIRGDINSDAVFDISDPVYALSALFSGGPWWSCPDAADVNDDGVVDISDAVYALAAQFSGGSAPPMPFPDCGADSTSDNLGCQTSACP